MKEHYKEIIGWASLPEGTKVWCKRKGDKHWCLQKSPSWLPDNQYIINDERAEQRKKEIDNAMV